MASLQERGGCWQCQFRYKGKRRTFALGAISEAEAKAAQVDYLLMRLSQGLLTLGAAIVSFVRHDGAIPITEDSAPAKSEPTLGELRDRYLQTHGQGSLEASTLRGINRHFRHLARLFGEGFPIRSLSLADLQGYVDKRSKDKGARGRLNPATIRKEIVTLRTAWNWGLRMGIVSKRYPYEGLRYSKTDEKPPFQTRAEIERQANGLPPDKIAELWEALYLTISEVEDLLSTAKENANHPWIHPLIATAAHTGARKGELQRMRIGEIDFERGVISIQERKRAHGRRTTRRVPMSSSLVGILADWLIAHPGGDLLFAHGEEVLGSKKRSRTTGHKSQQRPTGMADRARGVTERIRPGLLPLTEDEIHWHFKQTLRGTRWEIVRGLHALRHTFISALASSGVDQRIIDEVVGHQSEEQRRRYRHLYPATIKDAVRSVFG